MQEPDQIEMMTEVELREELRKLVNQITQRPEAARPNADSVTCSAVVCDEETLSADANRAWSEWWDGETNPNAIDGGWMWREGYEAGRRAHEGGSHTDRTHQQNPANPTS